jgi:hypothetical protein
MLDAWYWRLPVSLRGFVPLRETTATLQQCQHVEGRRLSARFGRGARDSRPPVL